MRRMEDRRNMNEGKGVMPDNRRNSSSRRESSGSAGPGASNERFKPSPQHSSSFGLVSCLRRTAIDRWLHARLAHQTVSHLYHKRGPAKHFPNGANLFEKTAGGQIVTLLGFCTVLDL